MSAMKRVRKPHLRGRNRHHLFLKIKFYWNTVIGWCLIFACLCATMANVSSCNIDSTQSLQYSISELLGKKTSLLTPALKRQKGRVMEGQCRSVRGEKQGCEGGRGEHRGDAERKGWGRQVCRGKRGLTHREALASQATWDRGQTSEGSTSHP